MVQTTRPVGLAPRCRGARFFPYNRSLLAFYGVVSETLTSAMVFFVVNQFTSHRFEVRSSGSSWFLLRERREHSS